jgi:hypothetical protein
MRTSSRKTTAAVLRDIIEIKVPEWAEILERSPHTIHDVECGRLKLSAALAAKMNYESGISIKWLLDGNPAARPISRYGEKYTKAIFEKVQARKKHRAHVEEDQIKYNALEFLRTILNILTNANRKRNYHLAAYRTWKALDELHNEFGADEKISAYMEAPYPSGLPLATLPEHAKNVWEALRQLSKAKQLNRDNPTKPKSKQASKKRRH